MRFAMLAVIGAVASLATTSAAQAPDWSNAETIAVRLSSFKFTPSDLILHRGAPYRLHLVDTAPGGHDFAAPQFFAASQIAPQDRAKIDNGRVELDGGESVDIRLVPLEAGTYRLHCSHFMHTAFGMKGTITVR